MIVTTSIRCTSGERHCLFHRTRVTDSALGISCHRVLVDCAFFVYRHNRASQTNTGVNITTAQAPDNCNTLMPAESLATNLTRVEFGNQTTNYLNPNQMQPTDPFHTERNATVATLASSLKHDCDQKTIASLNAVSHRYTLPVVNVNVNREFQHGSNSNTIS